MTKKTKSAPTTRRFLAQGDPDGWFVFLSRVAGRVALIEFRRHGGGDPLPFAVICPQFAEALAEYRDGPEVARYRETRAALVDTLAAAEDAARAVMRAEDRLADAAGFSGDRRAEAEAAHDAAVAHHAAVRRRVEILREATDAAWSAVHSGLSALSDRLATSVSAAAIEAIREHERAIAAVIGPHLDAIGQLIRERDLSATHRMVATDLRLDPPPPVGPPAPEPADLFATI